MELIKDTMFIVMMIQMIAGTHGKSLVNKHARLRRRKVRNTYNPWITKEIKCVSHCRDFLKKKAASHNSAYHLNEYKQSKNNLNTTTKQI